MFQTHTYHPRTPRSCDRVTGRRLGGILSQKWRLHDHTHLCGVLRVFFRSWRSWRVIRLLLRCSVTKFAAQTLQNPDKMEQSSFSDPVERQPSGDKITIVRVSHNLSHASLIPVCPIASRTCRGLQRSHILLDGGGSYARKCAAVDDYEEVSLRI